MNNDYISGSFTPAHELAEAVASNLLTHEEARTIYWSQFRILQRQAVSTPPAIQSAA